MFACSKWGSSIVNFTFLFICFALFETWFYSVAPAVLDLAYVDLTGFKLVKLSSPLLPECWTTDIAHHMQTNTYIFKRIILISLWPEASVDKVT